MKSGIDSIKALMLLLCTWLAATGAASAADPPGHWDVGLYGNLFGAREYQVWVPAGYDETQPLPLLLVLHGCVTGPNLKASSWSTRGRT
jgi:poly(3-hydroxybutyrate) depolymerase